MAKLYFYYAAMNAGKTTTLLQSSYNYQERGMDTLVFRPGVDTRYEGNKIISRIGLEQEAIVIEQDFDFFPYVNEAKTRLKRLACVFVDEAQFLTKKQVQQLVEVVNLLSIPVLAYGLRTDFLGETFEGSQYLLAWADEMIEIKTVCHCGRKATMNARIDAQGHQVTAGSQIEIGGNDRYTAMCRKHFEEGRRTVLKAVS